MSTAIITKAKKVVVAGNNNSVGVNSNSGNNSVVNKSNNVDNSLKLNVGVNNSNDIETKNFSAAN